MKNKAYKQGQADYVKANKNNNPNLCPVPRKNQPDEYYKGYADAIGPCYSIRVLT